jgi:putative SOS response-associated peptidase YedK
VDGARSDRIQTAPTCREPFKRSRCLVPASGWYEWQKISAKAKRPYHFTPKATPFAFGGVYDVWNADGKSKITSFSIVTANAAPNHRKLRIRSPESDKPNLNTFWLQNDFEKALPIFSLQVPVFRAIPFRAGRH